MSIAKAAFDISDPANVTPNLHNIRRLAGITTYGRPRWTALYVGDPPRNIIKRYLPCLIHRAQKCRITASTT